MFPLRYRSVFNSTLYLLMILPFVVGCRSSIPLHHSLKTATAATTAVQESKRVERTISLDSTNYAFIGLREKAFVARLYNARQARPFWFARDESTNLVDSMLFLIKHCRYFGLLPQDFHLKEIESLQVGINSEFNMMRMELLLTDAFYLMLQQVKYGRLGSPSVIAPDTIRFGWLNQATDLNLRNILQQQEPDFRDYQNLKKALKCVLDTMSAKHRQLFLQGSTPDSVAGFKEIQAIEINMERWRSEQSLISHRYLFVNIPSYQLQLALNDSVCFYSKIIVGKPDTPTPLLNNVVDCVVLFPYWYVPRKIAVEEYLPIIQRDSSFITRNNFEILNKAGAVLNPDSIDWYSFNKNYFPVSLRQREGTENSLGVIKFVFDNPYAVYLHDTNSKRSFSNKMRALSHGCVRVEKAIELAHILVTDNLVKKSSTITKYLKKEERHSINLSKPMPIYIRYITCEYRDDVLYCYADIYNQDAKLIALFYSHKNIENSIE